MIDYFIIFNRGGRVMYEYTRLPLQGDPINTLISRVLLEDRAALSTYDVDSYRMRWTLHNERQLVFAAVYHRLSTVPWCEDLLTAARDMFVELSAGANFQPKFEALLRKFDKSIIGTEAKGNDTSLKENEVSKKETIAKADSGLTDGDDDNNKDAEVNPAPASATKTGSPAPSQRVPRPYQPKSKGKDGDAGSAGKKKGKEARSWVGEASKHDMDTLDYSDPTSASSSSNAAASAAQSLAQKDAGKSAKELMPGMEEDGDDIVSPSGKSSSASKKSSFFSSNLFARITGSKVVEASDVDPILESFAEHLMSKNVAAEVANALCESIKESLLGTKVSTFESVHTLFTNALRESVTRILTPNRKVDILRDIAALEGKRPYVISFVGVNGVGKSTSLSKVCKWLQLNNLKVFLAACDTFRSGAIEQIKVHARNLGVPVFERPYGSDAAGVAKAAIQKAAADGYDVVLVDTAGRMQDNEPLMRALAKLIEVNTPDLVVFVGEALVGNDGVDQLRSFHQALKREGTRGVDGIFLTKFDTIDDKVGAALSMVYTTGQPVLFVGCGQTYMDLKRLHVGEVVRALLE